MLSVVRDITGRARTRQSVAQHDQDTTPARRQIIQVLNDVLAHTLDLGLQVRRLRWHATSPSCATLREMLGHMVVDLDSYSDLTAQRAVLLGGMADGYRDAGPQSDVETQDKVPEHRPFTTAALSLLTLSVASAAGQARQEMHDVAALGDPLSAHVLREVALGLDKWTWCLEVHLEGLNV